MDYKIKKLAKSEVEIKVTVPAERMEEFKKKACENLSHEVKVKGFRPGHVPPEVLEQHVEKKFIEGHTQEVAIQKTYAEIVIKEKIQVVSRPKVKIENEDPFEYTATVATMPDVEVKDHKSIKVEKKEAKATDKDVEEVIEDMKKHATTYKDVDRPIKDKDRAEIDFEGFDEKGKTLPGTKSENHPLVIGGASFIPGFEDKLLGLKKGEDKEFDITFPKDYGKADFQGKKVKFKVSVKRVEEPAEAIIDEAFVEKVTGKKMSVDQLKEDIKKNIQAKKEQEAVRGRENDYIEQLLKNTKVEVPDSLLDEETEYILQDMKNDIKSKGMEFDKFLEQTKMTEDDLRKKYRPEAEKRIKIRLALQFVIKDYGIKAEEADVKAELEKVKAQNPPTETEKIEKEFKDGSLKSQLSNKIALRKLFDKVLA